MSENRDLTRLGKSVLSDAQAEAEQILKKAEEQAGKIKQTEESRATTSAQRKVSEAQDDAAIQVDRAAARAQLDAQMLKLKRREQLLDQVFNQAKAKLSEMAAQDDWSQVSQTLLREALQALDPQSDEQGFIVHADSKTQEILNSDVLAALAKDMHTHLTMGDPLTSRTGVLVSTHNGRRQYDNTLEMRFSRLADELRLSVYNMLIGKRS